MDIQILKATYKDIDGLVNLYNELNDYLATHINYPGWKKGVYPTKEDAIHFFESDTLYVAKEGDKLLGSLALTHESEKEPEHGNWLIDASYDDIFVIHVFVVHPDYLRQGVGSAMLQFAEELGKQQHIKSIRLDVYENNVAAINAYKKQGYSYIDKVDIGLSCYGLDFFELYEKIVTVK